MQSQAGATPLRRIVIDTPTMRTADSLHDPAGEFRKTYGGTADTLSLIRPDGYLGRIATRDLLDSSQRAAAVLTPATTTRM